METTAEENVWEEFCHCDDFVACISGIVLSVRSVFLIPRVPPAFCNFVILAHVWSKPRTAVFIQ